MIGAYNIPRYVDLLMKCSLVLLATICLYYVDKHANHMLSNKDRIAVIKNKVEKNKQKIAYIRDTSNHIYSKDLVSQKELYNLLSVEMKSISKPNIIATTTKKIDPLKAGIIKYQERSLKAYEVNLIIEGDFSGLQKYIQYITQMNKTILWKEVIYDAKNFPKNYGSVTYYVFAR